MQIKRIIEVWEKGMDGAFIGQFDVAPTISVTWLQGLFAAEAARPDPQVVLGYFLTEDKLALIQPYVATPFDSAQYDYILSAIGVGSEALAGDTDQSHA